MRYFIVSFTGETLDGETRTGTYGIELKKHPSLYELRDELCKTEKLKFATITRIQELIKQDFAKFKPTLIFANPKLSR